jgi:AsmA protein
LIGLGVLGLVVAGALAFALARLGRFVDDNRAWIAEETGAALGRRVAFDELGVSLWGGVGVRVRGLVVGDDPAFSDQPFVRAADARVEVAILPALFGRYTVREVVLEQPEITVIRTPAGFNFDSLGRTATGPAADRPPGDGEPSVPPIVVVALVDVRAGRLRWIDRTVDPAVDAVLDRVDLEVSDVDLEEPIGLQLDAALPGASEQNLRVEGTVGPLGNPPDIAQAPVALTVRATKADMASLLVLLPPDVRLPPELTIAGPLDTDAEVKGALAAFEARSRVDLGSADVRWSEVFAKPPGTALTLEARGTRATTGDRLEAATLRVADLVVTLAGTLEPGDVPRIDGRVTSNRAALAPLAAMLPALADVEVAGDVQFDVGAKGLVSEGYVPELDGTVTLTGVAAKSPAAPVGLAGLTGTVALAGTRVTLPPSPCRIGEAPATVGLEIEDLEAEKGRFTFASPSVDLAAFGMKKGDVANGVAVEALGDASGEAPVVTATTRSTGGSVSGVAYGDLDTQLVRQADGIVVIERFGVRAYDGTLAVTGQVDPRDPKVPRFAVKPVVTDMSLAELAAKRAPLEGRVDLTADLSGSGMDEKTLRKTLAGTGNVIVRNGRLRGVNLIDGALGQLVGIPGVTSLIPDKVRKKHPGLFAPDETRFDDLRARFRIAAGVMHLPEVRLATSDYAVTGAGQAAFAGPLSFKGRLVASPALTADIVSGVKLARHLKGSSGHIEVPFEVAGTTDKPRVVPEAAYIAKALSQTIKEDGEELIQKGLDALFGGGKKQEKKRRRRQ